jgi:ornithine cyclodeaminase/alanine dehydrogenase-like protein (mu-crystallin family)
MLILSNEEIEGLLTMADCIEAIEQAYAAFSMGRAQNRPRTDLYAPTSRPDTYYVFKSMEGVIPSMGIAALRINSDHITWKAGRRGIIKEKLPMARGQYAGHVELYSTETGELLAMMPDGYIQKMRVGGTSGVAAKYLARSDARVLGLLGTGWQAGAHVEAMAAIRDLRAVRVFSPTPGNRRAFARTMSGKLGLPVEAVDRPEDAARGADILGAATNAVGPVIEPDWLSPGIHVTCVKESELGSAVIGKADLVVLHQRIGAPRNYLMGRAEPVTAHDPLDLLGLAGTPQPAAEAIASEAAPTLADLVAGAVPGRTRSDEVTCFINNMGAGIQFAAVGARVYQLARARGIGREIPTEWFLQDVHP